MTAVALAHDYSTQRGGAERVALWFAEAFPGAPMYTTLYDPQGTFPEFGDVSLHTSALDRVPPLRRHHRLALPFLAPAVNRQHVDAEVLLASSSGWAHGYRGAERTIVYCHAPARWLYQRDRYLGPVGTGTSRARHALAAGALSALSPALRRWDRRAAKEADLYLANSTVTQRAIRAVYGIEAEVVPPPGSILPSGPELALPGVEPGFLLCVARLLPYKNVDLVIEAARAVGRTLVVVGEGPDRPRLEKVAAGGGNTVLAGRVKDAELRWLYHNAAALIAASYEDYGLSPLEAGAFGVPAVVLRDGGYLDTVCDGVNGVFFDAPESDQVASAIEDALGRPWDDTAITAHLDRFSPGRFVSTLRTAVEGQRGQVAETVQGRGGHE